jgi:hypothetical protein
MGQKLDLTPALILTFSPRRRNSRRTFPVLRITVRPIQTRIFPETREPFPPLLEERVPDVASRLKEPNTKEAAFEDVVKSAQDAAVLVLVY